MRGQKECLHRRERSSDGTDDSVADGNAMQREKVCKCKNGGQLGHFWTSSMPPALQVLQGASDCTGLRVPAFVCVKTKKGVDNLTTPPPMLNRI